MVYIFKFVWEAFNLAEMLPNFLAPNGAVDFAILRNNPERHGFRIA
jgi:hypothetical protein